MEPQHEDRRLTAILAVDVVGYSGLMAADEGETLGQLRHHWTYLIEHIGAEKRSFPLMECNFLRRTAS